MKRKTIAVMLILFSSIGVAGATWTVGEGGDMWAGNTTQDDVSETEVTGYIELSNTIADYVAYWRFDDGSGTTATDENSTNGITGTLSDGNASNGVTLPTWTANAKYGSHSLVFDGDDDYVNCGNTSLLQLSDLTISVWCNATGFSPSNYNKILCRYYNGDGYYLEYQYGGIDFWVFKNWFYDEVSFPFYGAGCSLNEWNHFAAVYNGTHSVIYLNGVEKDSAALNESGVVDVNFTIGASSTGTTAWEGMIDDVRMFDRALTNDEINDTRDNKHYAKGNLTTNVQDATGSLVWTTVTIEGTTPTNTHFHGYWNHSTDGITYYVDDIGDITCGAPLTLYNQTRYGSLIVEAHTDDISLTPVLQNITMKNETQHGAPTITAYDPASASGHNVDDSLVFHVQISPPTRCKWYLDDVEVQFNQTGATDQYYTYMHMQGGSRNVTVVVDNLAGSDSNTWLFEVGAKSIDLVILHEEPANDTEVLRFDVERLGSTVTDWGIWFNHTFFDQCYAFRYESGGLIEQHIAGYDNESLYFDHASLLPVGVYYIEIGSALTDITIPADSYAMLRKITDRSQTFSEIEGGFVHDICYTWFDNDNACWESYWVGDSYNSGTTVPQNDAYLVLIDGVGETVSCGVATAESVAIPTGWSTTYLREINAKTLSQIKTDMQNDGTVTDLYAWNHTAAGTGAWTDTGTYSVLPNQGVLINNMGAPYNWDGTVS